MKLSQVWMEECGVVLGYLHEDDEEFLRNWIEEIRFRPDYHGFTDPGYVEYFQRCLHLFEVKVAHGSDILDEFISFSERIYKFWVRAQDNGLVAEFESLPEAVQEMKEEHVRWAENMAGGEYIGR